MNKKIILSFLLVLLISSIVNATTYYVDSAGGNDANPGTSTSQAWKTLPKVASFTFQAGDDILFKRGGTFTGTDWYLRHGGTKSDPVIIGAYGTGEKPVFNSGVRIICVAQNLGYITIQDVKLTNTGTGSAIFFNGGNLSNIIISRVEIFNSSQNGIYLAAIDTYLIEDCYLKDFDNSGFVIYGSSKNPPQTTAKTANSIADGQGADQDCFTIHKDSTGNDVGPNHLLINNTGSNCGEQAFDLTSGNNITLLNCEGYNNDDSSIATGHDVTNVLIDKFYSHDEKQMGIIITGPSFNIKVTNSIIYRAGYHQITIGDSTGTGRPCENIEIYNNVMVHGPKSTNSIIDISSGSHNIIFKNNIITSEQYAAPTRYVRYLSNRTPENTHSNFSNNIWWRPDAGLTGDNRLWYDQINSAYRFPEWQARFPNERFIDPKLVDPANGDLHLQSTSPAIDTGVNLALNHDFEGNPRPNGAGYDIGAFEYVSGTQPPSCTEAEWTHTDGACRSNNTLIRTWTKEGTCTGGITHPATETISCTYVPPNIPGDINNDGKVDVIDLSIVASDFGKSTGLNNAKSDTNNDGIVDIYAVVYVASRIT